jgi:hypothetical protein
MSVRPLSSLIASEPRLMVVQRFEEIIGGRVYQIEALLVRANCWRAQIVRIPGVPTALMPFYGATARSCCAVTPNSRATVKPRSPDATATATPQRQ